MDKSIDSPSVESPDLPQLHRLHPTDAFTGPGCHCLTCALTSTLTSTVHPSILTAPAGEAVSGAGAAAPAAPGGVAGVVPGAGGLLTLTGLAGGDELGG